MDIVHETVLTRNMRVPKLFTGLTINGSPVIASETEAVLK